MPVEPRFDCPLHVLGLGVAAHSYELHPVGAFRVDSAMMLLGYFTPKRIRRLLARHQRRLSQTTVAHKAGLSISYISMLERGERTPPLETLEVLAKALKVAPLDLLQAKPGTRGRSGKA